MRCSRRWASRSRSTPPTTGTTSALATTNRFISVHSLGFMWFNMIHMTNWVVNGIPERFPKLKTMWIE